MTDSEQRDFALRESDRYRIMASEMAQLGFKEYARWLRKNAENAMKWAARPVLPRATPDGVVASRGRS